METLHAIEQRRRHLQECLTQVAQVHDLAGAMAACRTGALEALTGRWTDTAAIHSLAEAVEGVWQLVSLLPPEYGASAHLTGLEASLQSVRHILLDHSLDPHRPLGIERALVLRRLDEVQSACTPLGLFLSQCLEAIGTEEGQRSSPGPATP